MASEPPHNIDAERALIGAILFDNELHWRVSDTLKADHFYDPLHGRIFALCEQFIVAGTSADPVTLKSRLESDEGYQALGAAQYLIDLMAEAPEGPAAVEYARIIRSLAVRRDLVRVAGEIAENALDTGQEPESLIETASAAIHGLCEARSHGKGFASFDEAMGDWLECVEAAYKGGTGLSGLSTGIRSLDMRIGGLAKSDLIIVAGRPGMGKTALALNVAHAVAKAGQSVGFFSLEMSASQLAGRQLAEFTGISVHDQRTGNIGQSQFQDLFAARESLRDLPLSIDATGGIDMARLRNRARRLQQRSGLDLIVVDYIQLMAGGKRTENRVQEVTEITQGLKALAKELQVPVIALSQLSRAVEQRAEKRPMLSDLRESGSIEQDADMVLFCYREEYYVQKQEPDPESLDHGAWAAKMDACKGKAEIIVGKQRHGPAGTVQLAFDGARTRFYDLDQHHEMR